MSIANSKKDDPSCMQIPPRWKYKQKQKDRVRIRKILLLMLPEIFWKVTPLWSDSIRDRNIFLNSSYLSLDCLAKTGDRYNSSGRICRKGKSMNVQLYRPM